MNNLADSGLNLRTIEVRQLSQIVTDLNYNFKQMLHLSGFKGQKGEEGDSIIGAAGQRGNMWIFADPSRFITLYSSVTTSGQVSLPFINGQLTSDLTTLLLALQVTELVQNDIIVLPSRDVIQFSSITNQFIDTGIRFADGLSLTEAEVINIVNNILGGLDNNDVFTTYKGVVKNYADNGAGLNVEENFNSILDLAVTGAGEGVISDVFQFTSLKEAVIDNSMQNMLLTGSPVKYHEIAQETISNKTVDFMAGIDDFGALAVMQNSYKNGILVGSVDDPDFSTWGRIFRTEDKFRFLSDYHPVLDRVSRLDLGVAGSELYSLNSLKMIVKSGFVSIEDYDTTNKWLYATTNNLDLGYTTLPSVTVRQQNYMKLFSSIGANTNILGLYDNEVKASLFQPKNDEIVNDPNFLVTHNLFYNFQVELNETLEDIESDIEELKNQEVYKEQTLHIGDVNANLINTFGIHVIKRSATSTYSNFANTYLEQGLVTDAILKIDRFDEGNEIWLEQTYVHSGIQPTSGTPLTLVTSKRLGRSSNSGASYVWGQWGYVLDSDNSNFIGGAKIETGSNNFGEGFSMIINHEVHGTTEINAQEGVVIPDDHRVLLGIELDEWGHPINPIPQNLDDWYYTKPEIDELIDIRIPIGAIIMWDGAPSTIPAGWFLCNGLNDTPDLQSKFVVGYDPTNTDYSTVGNIGGSSAQVLTEAQLPRHRHVGYTAVAGAHTHAYTRENPRGTGFAGSEDGNSDYFSDNTTLEGEHRHYVQTDYVGNSASFDNRPLYYSICFIQFAGLGVPRISNSATTYTGTVGIPFSASMTSLGVVTEWRAVGLPTGLSINTTTGQITGVPTSPITTTVTITAINSEGNSTPYVPTFIISPSVGASPVITSDNQIDVRVGTPLSFQITASGNPTSFNAVTLPSYLSIDTSTGLITGLAPTGTPNATLVLTISATNGNGTGTQRNTMIISSLGVGTVAAPNLVTNNRTIIRNDSVYYTHLNIGGLATSWSISGLPLILSFNTSSGVVTGFPTLADVGTYNITVSASNAGGNTSSNYTLTIVNTGSGGGVIV